jgi:excisionase family DNA binding protein
MRQSAVKTTETEHRQVVADTSSPGWMTTHEVAAILRVHYITVIRLIRQGLPAHKIAGSRWRFRRAEVDAWIDARGFRAEDAEPPKKRARR